MQIATNSDMMSHTLVSVEKQQVSDELKIAEVKEAKINSDECTFFLPFCSRF